MKRVIFFFQLTFVFACSSEFEIEKQDSKLVVEGYIENGKFPKVYLTLSSGFYDPVDSTNLLELVVTTARVAVSDGEMEEVLTLFRNTERFPPFYYEATDLIGEEGKTYRLNVRSRGEEYNAITTIPATRQLDSIWFENSNNSDSLGNIWLQWTDQVGEGNYYRIFSQVMNENKGYLPVYQSTIGDRPFDGVSFSLPLFQGTQSLTSVDNKALYKRGTTVNVRFTSIDKAHFDFWKSLEQEQSLAGNPFGSVGNEIESNITGTKNSLGVWGGYASTYYKIVIK